jgi:hypothetical protein
MKLKAGPYIQGAYHAKLSATNYLHFATNYLQTKLRIFGTLQQAMPET